jgi:hypothetical protein
MRFILLLVFLSSIAQAQKPKSPKTYAETITAGDLKKHLYIVAGKEMEGRGTATVGEQRAAAYIVNHFRSLGLLPGNNGSYLMPFPVIRDTLVNAAVEVNGQVFKWNTDFNAQMGSHSASMNFGGGIYLGGAQPDSSVNAYLMGRLAIVSDYPALYYAQSKGAAAIILVKKDTDIKQDYHNRSISMNASQYSMSPLTFIVSEKVANTIMANRYAAVSDSAKMEKFKPVSFTANIKLEINKQTDKIFANNVVGYIEGTDKKDEYLFITAHYDHIGKHDNVINYGADDDGSGTVSVLEMAEAFAKAKATGNGPRRSVVFMTVSGEEKGLWGSEYYSNHPIFPLEKTTADLNIDMVGRIDPDYKGDSLNYIYTIGDNKLSSDLSKILSAVNKKYSRLQIDKKFNDPNDPNRFYYRSDHYNFAKKGVPIIFYFNGVHADYHQPTDTPDKINYPLMEKRARLIFHTAWEIANRDEMLKRDKPL